VRPRIAGAALTAVVAVVVGALLIAGGGRRPAGPLLLASDSELEYHMTAASGQPWTWGIDLPPTAEGPLVLDAVEFTDVDNVTVVRILAAKPPTSIGLVPGPIPGSIATASVVGATAGPAGATGGDLQLLVEVQRSGSGAASLNGLRIQYHLDAGASYDDILPISLRILEPPVEPAIQG
jgi:hypothetical protein